ncbi:MAG TPA: glutamate--tRNA ligase, partial [Bacteroidales bacterium]
FSTENTEQKVKAWIEENGYNMGAIMNNFRLLIVGEPKGPHLFDIISLIGKKETLSRIEAGMEKLGKTE